MSTVLRLWVERLKGVPNARTADGPPRCVLPDFARFRRVAELLQAEQDPGLGAVHAEERPVEISSPFPAPSGDSSAAIDAAKGGLQYLPREDGSGWGLFRPERRLVFDLYPQGDDHPVTLELEALLHLHPGRARYEIVVTPAIDPDPSRTLVPHSPAIRVMPRSNAQVFSYLANGVEVPREHVDAGIIRPAVGPDGGPFDARVVTDGLLAIHSCRCHKPPATAFVAAKYWDYW